MRTQEILEELYIAVIDKLRTGLIDFDQIIQTEKKTLTRIAEMLEVGVEESLNQSNDEDRHHTATLALMPVAQRCVIIMLRSLLKTSKESPDKEFSEERLEYVWANYTFDWDKFPQSIGLDEEAAKFAVAMTAQTLLETNLFQTPQSLEMDGEKCQIVRKQDKFLINI